MACLLSEIFATTLPRVAAAFILAAAAVVLATAQGLVGPNKGR